MKPYLHAQVSVKRWGMRHHTILHSSFVNEPRHLTIEQASELVGDVAGESVSVGVAAE